MANPNNGLVLGWTAVMIIIYAIVVYLIVDSHRNKKKGADPKINFEELTKEYAALPDSTGKVNLTVKGTVTKKDLSGGFYGVITEDGDEYLPINIQKKLTQGERTISMSGYTQANPSIFMWGTYMYVNSHKFTEN
jgi:hypothetical protein